MAVSTVTATVVVNFDGSDGAGSIFKVEVDGRDPADGGLNGGDTTFAPGDAVYLLLYLSEDVTHDTDGLPFSTQGTLSKGGPLGDTEIITFSLDKGNAEYIQFNGNGNTSQTAYPMNNPDLVTPEWIGAKLNGGVLRAISDTTIKGSDASKEVVGIARVEYSTTAIVYKLDTTGLTLVDGSTKFEVLCYFKGTSNLE